MLPVLPVYLLSFSEAVDLPGSPQGHRDKINRCVNYVDSSRFHAIAAWGRPRLKTLTSRA